MDGSSYQNIYRGGSPLTPGTTGSAYKPNVNRTKTRKWVEAKVQSYDGDDWGNEYEDEDDEPEEPMPPVPMHAGMRQPGQAGDSFSSRVFSQPTSASSRFRNDTNALRSPSGPPALQIQTQHTPASTSGFAPIEAGLDAVSDPSSLGSPLDHVRQDHIVSPQSAGPKSFSGRLEFQSQGAGQLASRFPPRKSSISQQDLPNSRSGSRPGSSSSNRPWADQRSGSPVQSTGPGKPSFVRPSDIYRRMEEEKERERRSIESARASMDSVLGVSADNVRSPTEQQRRMSFEKDGGSDMARNLKPTLDPLAERRNEYDLERLSVQAQNGSSATQGQAVTTREAPSVGVGLSSADSARQLGGQDGSERRRLSTSPRLPDLGRISSFGEDLFTSTRLPINDPRTLSTASDTSTPEPALATQPQYFIEPPSDAVPRGQSPVKRTSQVDTQLTEPSSIIQGPALVSRENSRRKPVPERELSPDGDRSTSPQKTVQSRVGGARPSIPGGWVSETTNVWSEGPTPMEQPEIKTSTLVPVEDAEVSPVSEAPDEIEPTTTLKHVQSLDHSPKSTAKIQAKHANHVTLRSLPLLQTEDPLQSSDNIPAAERTVPISSEVRPSQDSYKESPSNYSANTRTATTASDFTPTAPLKPRRSEVMSSDFTAPGMPPRGMTTSSVDTTSAADESDRLREDIIKSLGPTSAPNFGASLGKATGNQSGPNEIGRESTYLSDVYDDYLVPHEEKSPQETGQTIKDESHGDGHRQPQQTTPDVTLPTPRKSSEPQLSSRSRRFSFDQGPEQVTLSPVDVPRTSHLGPDFGRDEASSEGPTSQSGSQATSVAAEEPALHTESDESRTMSHQVSQVSSHTPGGLGILEPPSPISVISAAKSPNIGQSAPATDGRRISLADANSLIQSSSNPISPSPPHDGHPALSGSPRDSSPLETSPVPVVPALQQPKIMAFREILNIPEPAQRIQKFEEARVQYASMDSGLTNWVLHVLSQPEHGNSPVYPDLAASSAQSHMQGKQSETGTSSQQPYYQQYLNGSNPNLVMSAPARQSTGNMLQGQTSSGFGPSGNKMGPKGKELLHAAGIFGGKATKSGMKLFNRGKSKLRSTGDKDQESDQAARAAAHVAPRAEQQRRSSWGFIGWRNKKTKGHSSSFSLSHLGHWKTSQAARISGAATPAPTAGVAERFIAKNNAASSAFLHSVPQLPSPARVSPFDPSSLSRDDHDARSLRQAQAPWQPPRQVKDAKDKLLPTSTPPLQTELVSPISDIRSSTPQHRRLDERDDEQEPRYQLSSDPQSQAPTPITSKPQSAWDPFTGTHWGKEGFELDSPAKLYQSAQRTHPQLSAASSPRDAAHLTTDDRSDGWIKIASRPHQTTRSPNFSVPINMAAPMAAERPYVPAVEPQHALQQDEESYTPARHQSFVGLPPIRRSSTLGLLGMINRPGQGEDGESIAAPASPADDEIPDMPSFSFNMPQQTTNGHLVDGRAHHGQDTPIYFVQKPGFASEHFAQGSPVARQNGTSPNGFANGRGQIPNHMMAQGGGVKVASLPMQNQPFMPPGRQSPMGSPGGNPIQRFPPGPWKLEESHLSEPLASSRSRASNNGSPPAQQPGPYAFDKETKVETPVSAGTSSQPTWSQQQGPRPGRDDTLPPVTVQRFPALFPLGNVIQPHDQPQQVPEFTPGDDRGNMRDSGLSKEKELGGKFMHRDYVSSASNGAASILDDEVSETSVVMDEQRGRKKAWSILGLGNPQKSKSPQVEERAHSDQPVKLPQQSYAPTEKKKNFFGVTALPSKMPSFGLTKSDTSSILNEPSESGHSNAPAPTPVPVKKRLSDLKGLLKGNSKEDDTKKHANGGRTQQSTHFTSSGRSSMQASPGFQNQSGPHPPGSQMQPGQNGMLALPPFALHWSSSGRPGTQPSQQGPQAAPQGPPKRHILAIPGSQTLSPSVYQGQPMMTPAVPRERSATQESGQPTSIADLQGTSDNRGKKPGGFLSGLFVSKPKAESKAQPSQQMSPGQFGQTSRGQLSPPGQHQFAPVPRMIHGAPQGQPGQSPITQTTLVHPSQGLTTSSPTTPQSQIHEYGQIGAPAVSSFQVQPGVPLAQSSQKITQVAIRSDDHELRRPLNSNPVNSQATQSGQRLGGLTSRDSLHLSQTSSQEKASAEGSSIGRKPVGSGPSRQDRVSSVSSGSGVPATQSTTIVPKLESQERAHGSEALENERRLLTHATSIQNSPQLEPANVSHMRQNSIPTPAQSPAPQASPPGRIVPRVSAQSLRPPGSPRSQANIDTTNGRASMSPQPGRLSPGPQMMGFNRNDTMTKTASATTGQRTSVHPQGQWRSPPPSIQEPKSTISKFFGSGIRRSTSPQPPNNQTPPPKEQKESTSSKLMGAFKRVSKQPEPARGQHMQPIVQGGRGQPTTMMPQPMHQPPTGRGGISSPGLVGPGQPSQSQVPKPMPMHMQGPGQMQAGRDPLPRPQMVPGQVQEQQQFPQVPIPQGYQAVHGYNMPPSMVAQSPYNIGRGMPIMPYGQQQQHQPMMQHPGGPPQPWDPTMMPPRAVSPYGQMPMQFHAGQPGPPFHQQTPTPQFPSQNQPQHLPQQNIVIQPSTNQSPRPQNQASPPLQHGSPQPQTGIFLPPQINSDTQKTQPHQIVTMQNSKNGQPQVQHPGSPQTYSLPDSAATFSPVNPGATRLPNPPLPPAEIVQGHSQPIGPAQRLIGGTSHTPLPPTSPPAGNLANDQEPPRNISLSPDLDTQRTFSVSPEPSAQVPAPVHQASNPNLNVDAERANSHSTDVDDIYDATPRNSRYQAPKEHQDMNKNAFNSNGAAVGATVTAGNNGYFPDAILQGSSNVNPTNQGIPMEPEEKILVDQPVELAAVLDDDDSMPVMTATSYPGMEWNPYSAGEFGNYD